MLSACKIFVSYSFSDDYPTGKIQNGWVSSFAVYLKEMLNQVLKSTHFTFLLEHDLHINKNILNERAQQLKESDILLVVVSPNFIESTASHKLVNNYIDHIHKEDSNPNKKIFKVVKFPIQQNELPIALQSISEQPFYNTDKETGQALEITDHFDKEAKSSFWLPLSDLCFEIKKVVEGNKQADKPIEKEKYVFLAKTGADLKLERAVIKRELERRDYKVLPNGHLPVNENLLEQTIFNHLEKSLLSIHLVGNQSGERPDDSEESYIEIQNRVAANYTQKAIQENAKFSRLIWIASEEKNIEEKQQFYIEQLKRDKSLQLGADILETQLEDFKSSILNYLAERLNDKSFIKEINSESRGKSIYLISDKRDINYAQNIAHFLAKLGFEVMISSFDRKKANSRRTHQALLNKCDIACVLFFDAKQEWLVAKLQDILKSAGMGKTSPFEQKIIITDQQNVSNFLEKLSFLKHFQSKYHVINTSTENDYKEAVDFFSEIDAKKNEPLTI